MQVCKQCVTRLDKCSLCKSNWNRHIKSFMGDDVIEKYHELMEARSEEPTEEQNFLISWQINDCKTECAPDKIIYHVVQKHAAALCQWESEENGDIGTSVIIYYRPGMTFDFASVIGDLGLVFKNILIEMCGELKFSLNAAKLPAGENDYYVFLEVPNKDPVESRGKISTCSGEKFSSPAKYRAESLKNVPDNCKITLICIYKPNAI